MLGILIPIPIRKIVDVGQNHPRMNREGLVLVRRVLAEFVARNAT